MADVKERPTAASAPAGYDEDFHAWAFAQADLVRIEDENPSLKAKADRIAEKMYRYGRKEASVETDLPLDAFPAECPFTLDQLRDDEFLPD
jgi:hypothetical protein